MAKEKWGTKRTCPKCGARFYDLGNDSPVVCIECETRWTPEPILKSKQPFVAPVKKDKKEKAKVVESDTDKKDDAENVEVDEDDVLADVDLNGDDKDDDNDDPSKVIDAKIEPDTDTNN